MTCDYETGDYVLAECTVTTGGCLQDRTLLFRCVTDCNSQNPGTIVDQQKWTIASQCNNL
jgi:hypothetical protein